VKPILFLDIDGVLNTPSTTIPEALDPPWPPVIGVSEEVAHLMIERPLVERLSTIVAAAGCDIVFHTTWIYQWTTSEIVTFLQRAGLDVPNCVFDSTKAMGGREARIRLWLAVNGERHFAVLDDCHSPKEFPTACLGRLVHVDGSVGLQPSDVQKAVKLMSGWSLGSS
jgi:hypothetical protein